MLPSLCIKLCYQRFKHVFSPLASALNLLVIPDLVLASEIISSSTALSWPHGTEFSDSYLKLRAFSGLSFQLSCDEPDFRRFLEDIPFAILQRLANVDYRKSVIANQMMRELEDLSGASVFGIRATARTSSHTVFEHIYAKDFVEPVPAEFLLVCSENDYLQ